MRAILAALALIPLIAAPAAQARRGEGDSSGLTAQSYGSRYATNGMASNSRGPAPAGVGATDPRTAPPQADRAPVPAR